MARNRVAFQLQQERLGGEKGLARIGRRNSAEFLECYSLTVVAVKQKSAGDAVQPRRSVLVVRSEAGEGLAVCAIVVCR